VDDVVSAKSNAAATRVMAKDVLVARPQVPKIVASIAYVSCSHAAMVLMRQ
jgi:hypothetical protein